MRSAFTALRSDGFFSLFQGGGEVHEIVVRQVLHFVDQSGQGEFEFCQGNILLRTLGGGNDGAQISYSLFQRGGHD